MSLLDSKIFKWVREEGRLKIGVMHQVFKESLAFLKFDNGSPEYRQTRKEALMELWNSIDSLQKAINADTEAQKVAAMLIQADETRNTARSGMAQAEAEIRHAIVTAHGLFKDEPEKLKQVLAEVDPKHLKKWEPNPKRKEPEPNMLPDTAIISMQMGILAFRTRLAGAMNTGQAYRENWEDRWKEFCDSISTDVGAGKQGAGRFQMRRAEVHKAVYLDLVAYEWMEAVQRNPSFTPKDAMNAVISQYFTHSTPDYDPWENMVKGATHRFEQLQRKYDGRIIKTLQRVYQARDPNLHFDTFPNDNKYKKDIAASPFRGILMKHLKEPPGRAWDLVSKVFQAEHYNDQDPTRNWGAYNAELRQIFGDEQPTPAAIVKVVTQNRLGSGGRSSSRSGPGGGSSGAGPSAPSGSFRERVAEDGHTGPGREDDGSAGRGLTEQMERLREAAKTYKKDRDR